MKKRWLLAALCTLLIPVAALPQSNPGFTTGQVPTAAQWNSYFTAKQDALSLGTGVLTALGLNVSGTGAICLASGSACTGAGSNITIGTTTITGGTTARVLFDNAGVAGEYVISGTGNVAMTTNPAFTTPNLGTPSAIVLTNASALPASAMPSFGSGDVSFAAAGGAGTIANNAVTNAKAAQMAAHTIKGNNTAGTANAIDLTDTQATAELNPVVGDSGSGGTKGLVPAPGSGDAAAGKFLKADGTWAVPAGGGSGCSPGGASTNILTDNGSGACTSNADAKFVTGTITLGTNTTEAGVIKLFGGTSGNLSLKAAAAAGTNTVLTFPGGTTDFSATGGTHQVVKQSSAGGAFTVGQLACADLSDSVATCNTAVSVTAGTPNVVVTPSPGVGTFTVGTTAPINAQTGTTYVVLTGDNAKIVTLSNTSAVAVTLAQAGSAGFASGWGATFVNINTGVVTITTTTSTFNGSGSTVILPQGSSVSLASDGTNWIAAFSAVKIPGTSGGIPYYAATNELLSSGALTANKPVIGGGAGTAPSVGTTSGNTTEFGTVSGSLTSGNCIKSDASGNLVDAATTCGGGGSGIGVKIATCTAASTTCNFNALGSHDYYNLKCSGLTVSTSANIIVQVNSDSTSGHYAWAYHYGKMNGTVVTGDAGIASDTSILIANGLATTDVFDFEMNLKNLASTTLEKQMTFQTAQGSGVVAGWQTEGAGEFTVTGTAVTSIQVLTSTGTFGSGANKCTLYAYDA